MPIEPGAGINEIGQTAAERAAIAQSLKGEEARQELQKTKEEIIEISGKYADRGHQATGMELTFPPQPADYHSNGEREFAQLTIKKQDQEDVKITVPLGYYSESGDLKLAAIMPDGSVYPTTGAWNRAGLKTVSLSDINGNRHEIIKGITSETKFSDDQIYSSRKMSDGTTIDYDFISLPKDISQLQELRDMLKNNFSKVEGAVTELPADSPNRKVIEGQTQSEIFRAEEAEAERVRKEQTEQTGAEIIEISKQFFLRGESVNGVKLEQGTAEHSIPEGWDYRYEYIPEYAVINISNPDGTVRSFTQPLAFIEGDRRRAVVVMADGSIHKLDGAWFRNELHTVSETDKDGRRYELISGISEDPNFEKRRDLLSASTVHNGKPVSEPKELADGRKIQYYWTKLPNDLESRQELLTGLSSTIKGREVIETAS